MSMWRCPHCGTPQAESSRCWVCHRSSTTCSTCRHFRRSVAAQIGYCGLDPRRLPLAGTEMRGCWEPAADHAAESPGPAAPAPAAPRPTANPSLRLRDFVPVELQRDYRIVLREDHRRPAEADSGGATDAGADEAVAVRAIVATGERPGRSLTLFGEAEAR
ncbi:MAG: hypothetical protein HY264_00430 [Chloroflexi bacterium]|nr:hypothetical protein [Chloroflexota bacterium]